MAFNSPHQRRVVSKPKAVDVRISSVVLSMSFAALTLVSANANAKDDTQAIVEKVQKSKQQIAEADAEKRRILGSLYTIQQRMKKISHEKAHLTDQLFQAQDNVKNIAKVIASLEEEIVKQRLVLRRRLRALYKLSGEGYVSILFSRSNPADLDETLRFMRIVTESDYQLIRSYQSNIDVYNKQKTKLKSQVERLVGIEKRIKKQEGLLVVEHKSKSKIVSELDHKKDSNINKIKSLRTKNEVTGDAEMAELLRPSIFEQKGQLPAPVVGSVIQDFGLVTDEKYKIRFSHKGWTYSTAQNSEVQSVFDGTVVRAEWIGGYGTTVVVDHGDHYYSVYSHIARLRTKVGDNLKKGQALGEAGALGDTTGFGLYFELRHFSEAENPTAWIAKKAELSANNSAL